MTTKFLRGKLVRSSINFLCSPLRRLQRAQALRYLRIYPMGATIWRALPPRTHAKIRFLRGSLVIVTLAGFSGIALAQGDPDIGDKELESRLRVKLRTVQNLALNPLLVKATRAQNRQSLSMDEIVARDDAWKASEDMSPFKHSLHLSRAGQFLNQTVSGNPALSEVFLTDNQGANVAAYPTTSDYWQGDEAKWIESFNQGNGRIFIGPIEFDDSSQTYQAQVSAPVIDRGKTIGVLVVGINLSYIESSN